MVQEIGTLSPSALLEVLDELAGLVENAKPVFMSQDVRVDKQALVGLVDELRHGLPSAVARSDELLRQAQDELEDARRSGEETLAVARQRALELVEQEQVVAQANARAADIVAAAEQQAAKLRADADAYCDARLASFEEDLDALTAQVKAGRAKLAERLGPDAGRPRWDSVRDPEWPAG
jgi:cell division septum initiation protein DivIVA